MAKRGKRFPYTDQMKERARTLREEGKTLKDVEILMRREFRDLPDTFSGTTLSQWFRKDTPAPAKGSMVAEIDEIIDSLKSLKRRIQQVESAFGRIQ